MKASSYDQIADHLDAGGRVTFREESIDVPTSYGANHFRTAVLWGVRPAGMRAPEHYELNPLQVDVAALERRHHNRVSGLQRKVRKARNARDRALLLLSERDATIAELRENERELASTLGRVASERDQLKTEAATHSATVKEITADRDRLLHQCNALKALRGRLEPTEDAGVAAQRPTRVIPLCDARPDDVFAATRLPVGRLWRKDGARWLHHPEGIGWQEGYQPVPFEQPDGGHLVRIFERSEAPGLAGFTKERAEAQGFTVDTTTYPWTAYKGPRFEPVECYPVSTPAVET